MIKLKALVLLIVTASSNVLAKDNRCPISGIMIIKGSNESKLLSDGSVIATGKININIDGYARSYHPKNADAGALIHLCNAGQIFLPNGQSYYGSKDNSTCTGRFMSDVAKIKAAGWKDSSVGLVRWFGILGRGSAKIGSQTIKGVEPVLQNDGSGFYVSPTALIDNSITDETDQSRYINALRIPAAVIPSQPVLRSRGVVMGSFGVAYDKLSKRAVPFVVGDYGPAIGEATPALARQLAGQPIVDNLTRATRFVGLVSEPRITWVFFGMNGGKASYDSRN